MKPDPNLVLQGVGMAILTQLTPEIATPFGQSLAGMAGMLNLLLSQEVDGLANRLQEENRALVLLLQDAGALLDAPALAARCAAAPDALALPDIRVSTLQGANDRLRALLIDVHATIEATPGEEAAAMNERIWDELRESTRRRHLISPR